MNKLSAQRAARVVEQAFRDALDVEVVPAARALPPRIATARGSEADAAGGTFLWTGPAAELSAQETAQLDHIALEVEQEPDGWRLLLLNHVARAAEHFVYGREDVLGFVGRRRVILRDGDHQRRVELLAPIGHHAAHHGIAEQRAHLAQNRLHLARLGDAEHGHF